MIVCSACSVLTSPFPAFESVFNCAWADNADALSDLYTGTGAQKTDFTRTGRRTLGGAATDLYISLKRWVLNNLSDGRTQDAWDLFLGRFIPRKADASDSKDLTAAAASGAKGGRKMRVSPAATHAAGPSPVSNRTAGALPGEYYSRRLTIQ